jgi:hypothetical protein
MKTLVVVIKNGMLYECFSDYGNIKVEVLDLDTNADIKEHNKITQKYQEIKDTLYPIKF